MVVSWFFGVSLTVDQGSAAGSAEKLNFCHSVHCRLADLQHDRYPFMKTLVTALLEKLMTRVFFDVCSRNIRVQQGHLLFLI
jgi:hypothetical protein